MTDRVAEIQERAEPGDRIGCGNTLVYDHRGWRLAAVSSYPEASA